MRYIFKKYWLVIKFILSFILVYSILTIGYKLYLDWSDGSTNYPDYFTNLVGRQSQEVLIALDYPTKLEAHPDEPSLKMIIRNKYVARVVEGCNSISIIILFIAFVISFSNNFKKTILFILGGSVLIYAANLVRIVILSAGLYHYPWRREFLHSVVFPLIIYGMVFLLWMLWINHFAKTQQTLEKSY
ncbi:MAG: exosortase family protein XrtF [Bacteroidota bacterium]